MKEKKSPSEKSEDDDSDIVDKDGKIKFDRRQFDLNMYIDIVKCLHNLEFTAEDKKKKSDKFSIVKNEGEPAKILYNDLLQSQEIT